MEDGTGKLGDFTFLNGCFLTPFYDCCCSHFCWFNGRITCIWTNLIASNYLLVRTQELYWVNELDDHKFAPVLDAALPDFIWAASSINPVAYHINIIIGHFSLKVFKLRRLWWLVVTMNQSEIKTICNRNPITYCHKANFVFSLFWSMYLESVVTGTN